MPPMINTNPKMESGETLSWNIKYPTPVVIKKFIPVARGMIREKLLVASALKSASAETTINEKAATK